MRWLAFVVFVASFLLAGEAARGIDVTFECSADFYAQGDTVFFTWTNNTDTTIVASNHPPYEIYDAETNAMICVTSLPMEFHLGPHQWVRLEWDQLDCLWNPVPPGPYIARISFVMGVPPPFFEVEDSFVILDPASVPEEGPRSERGSWGRVRSLFRQEAAEK